MWRSQLTIDGLSFQPGTVTETVDATVLDEYLGAIPDWQVAGMSIAQLVRDYTFTDFLQALAAANAVGELSERHGHHPELTITYGGLHVAWWTHTASGITTNDVFMASQCDEIIAGI